MNAKKEITTTEETTTTSSTTTTSITTTSTKDEKENEEKLLVEEPKKLIANDQESAINDDDLEHDIQDNISSITTEPEVVSDQSETLSEKLPARIASKSVCPDFAENFRKSSSAPKYNLNENRLISHFVSNGPNNQIVDFRHGLYWAIKLNITTTLPLFYEHFTVSKTNSRSNSSSILPKHRIKLDSALLSSISPEEFGRRCSNQEIAFLDATPDGANQFQHQKRMRLPKLYEFYGIDKSFFTRFQPIKVAKTLTKDEDYANNWPARSQNYNCSIFAHPYRSKYIKMSEEDEKLWKEIVRATPRPQYISKMAEEFIEEEMSQRFLAIHWRKGLNFYCNKL
ncbi:unnamed protein product [Oikopleura dioica]|uniref:Peptide-O-fucosyltransferase n=1 Tax=Oikopleura dioica TaxID=34765 RepID=E4X260_OIKDI|nr:unnamed protein product [Oikopleura dioica]